MSRGPFTAMSFYDPIGLLKNSPPRPLPQYFCFLSVNNMVSGHVANELSFCSVSGLQRFNFRDPAMELYDCRGFPLHDFWWGLTPGAWAPLSKSVEWLNTFASGHTWCIIEV